MASGSSAPSSRHPSSFDSALRECFAPCTRATNHSCSAAMEKTASALGLCLLASWQPRANGGFHGHHTHTCLHRRRRPVRARHRLGRKLRRLTVVSWLCARRKTSSSFSVQAISSSSLRRVRCSAPRSTIIGSDPGPLLALSGRANRAVGFRFQRNNGHDADVTRCLLMTQTGSLSVRLALSEWR